LNMVISSPVRRERVSPCVDVPRALRSWRSADQLTLSH